MKSIIKTIGLLALFALVTPRIASAEDKPAAKTDTAKKGAKGKYIPLYAQVEAISATELTIKGTENTKFVINAETKITKDKEHKETATTADAKVGQWVGGSYTKAADGSNVLHSLHLGVSQDGPKAKKKKE